MRWWLEGRDAVFSFVPSPQRPTRSPQPSTAKLPAALKNPIYNALAKADPGVVPVGFLFVDLAGLPPAPASGPGRDRRHQASGGALGNSREGHRDDARRPGTPAPSRSS